MIPYAKWRARRSSSPASDTSTWPEMPENPLQAHAEFANDGPRRAGSTSEG